MELDPSTAAEAFARPGMDPRQWISYGIVNADSEEARSVLFDDDDGELPFPLVIVTLQPSGVTVPCRVAGMVAGEGEADWFPFVGGDEVLVAIPEGDERAGCCIIGRLNQAKDKFPRTIAGADTTQNTMGFRRMRTPYVLETASGYMVRSATTGAAFAIDQAGAIFLNNGDKHLLAMTADVVSLGLGDQSAYIQFDASKSTTTIAAKETSMVVSADESKWLCKGTLALGTSGVAPTDHAISVEAVVGILNTIFTAIGVASTAPPALVAFLATFTAPATLAGLVTASAAAPLPSLQGLAITAGLAIPKSPGSPGIGCAGLTIG